MTNTQKLHVWVEAARPQTLAAAIVPVMVGAALAYHQHLLNISMTGMALLCALLIQIGTNFANDYFDAINGADTDERIGFERATAAGHISQRQMLFATILTMGLAFACGLYLVYHAGWIVFMIGVASLTCGILYTGGPFPLGYNGLGDLFVFLFFGIIAVMTTYYVNALQWSAASFWASLAIGSLCVNILVVNNLRDVEQDGPAGKNTLGVLMGESALRWEYFFMLILAFAIPPHFFFRLEYGSIIFLPFIMLPGAILLMRQILYAPKRKLNRTLKLTGIFLIFFGILFSIGVIYG